MNYAKLFELTDRHMEEFTELPVPVITPPMMDKLILESTRKYFESPLDRWKRNG